MEGGREKGKEGTERKLIKTILDGPHPPSPVKGCEECI